ncbi:MAG: PD-(D/E)XK nuclease family protein [Usitatibacter sp.]
MPDIMASMQDFPSLARGELFSRLATGHAARLTVLTPNRRLAQSLQARFDRFQLAAGRTSWEAAEIAMFGDFLQNGFEQAAYSESGARLASLLTAAEAQILWEEAIRASPWREKVLSVPATAALAMQAWCVAHEWRIAGALDTWPGNEDCDAFADWRRHYVRRTGRERMTDEARLPEEVATCIAGGTVQEPATIVLYAFDVVKPQQQDFLAACARAGSEVLQCAAPALNPSVKRLVLESPRQELELAARWARSRLREGFSRRIAVVVPDLEKRRAEVARVFSRVLATPLFNISLGGPLSATPLADAALGILELAGGPIGYDRASRIIRSPFIAGAQKEHAERARLDASLRRLAPATVSLVRLRALIPEAVARRGAPECPALRAALDRLIAAAEDAARAPAHEWARRFTALLDAAGFPGERGLDSTEFQTLGKWREMLAALATLGSVAPAWSAPEARARMQRLCTDTVFQPASGEAPVQVLGILESAGLEFDHLWVSGLTEEAWPLAARPHALIAPALQKQAGIPQATPEKALEVDRALTQAWRRSAGEVLFSSARADGDRELLPSALIADIAPSSAEELAIPKVATRREALFAAGREPGAMATRIDNAGPAIATAQAQGGTAILVDQAACPFRAFAHFRLDARSLERPEPGLGPAERGQLLHTMMAKLWGGLRDHRTLVSIEPARLEALIEEAAAHAVARLRADRPGRLEGRFAELERARLAGLAREWLEIERSRPPFEVRLSEERITLSAGSLRMQGRVDRIDRIEGAGLAVIDYKSGPVSASSWLGERPDDVQLPLYALAADEPVDAVAFARLKTGQVGFAGIAREAGLLPAVKPVEEHRAARKFAPSWPELLAEWRNQVDRLGEGFAGGDARVDPKNALSTCERCDLKPLCRVHERLGSLEIGDAPDVEAE